jgi:5-methylcytosine-specific restriction endonuclease McrA
MKLIKTLVHILKSEHLHFLLVDYKFYKRWKFLVKLAVKLNKKYVACEIFRKEYKHFQNFVVIGLRWNGKNVKRRTNGYAKEFIELHETNCIYCDTKLTPNNATSDHIVPISLGGNNCQVNLVVCCLECNNERGNIEFKTFLRWKNIKFRNIKHPFI